MPARFRDLPLSIQIAFGLTLLNSWILFEETIIDRTSLARALPNYGVGVACVWDLGAVLAIAGIVVFLRRKGGAPK